MCVCVRGGVGGVCGLNSPAHICAFSQCVFLFDLRSLSHCHSLSFSHLLERSLKRRKAFVVEKNEMFLAFAAWSACLEWPELCKVLATFGL